MDEQEVRLPPHDFARKLRKQATYAERVLWDRLRGQKLEGFKFSFQVPIDKFTADCCCRSHKLIVEVDGASHVGREMADLERDGVLVGLGYVVLRFSELDIFEDMPVVLMKILDALERRPHFRY